MKEAFDKIVEQLEAAKDIPHDDSVAEAVSTRIWNKAIQRAIGIVQGVAKEYNNGWIAISESVPDSDRFILLSFENYHIPIVGRYVEDDEGGTFYAGHDLSLASQNLFVNAWMELPEPYKGE